MRDKLLADALINSPTMIKLTKWIYLRRGWALANKSRPRCRYASPTMAMNRRLGSLMLGTEAEKSMYYQVV